MKRKLKSAVLHDVIFIPGIGQVKTTIDDTVYRGCQLELDGNLVLFTCKNILSAIPTSNFKVLVLEPEVVSKK